MALVFKNGATEIWEVRESYGSDFYVYAGSKLVRVCPSLGMAHEVAAGA
jgi:hypothetical protein